MNKKEQMLSKESYKICHIYRSFDCGYGLSSLGSALRDPELSTLEQDTAGNRITIEKVLEVYLIHVPYFVLRLIKC